MLKCEENKFWTSEGICESCSDIYKENDCLTCDSKGCTKCSEEMYLGFDYETSSNKCYDRTYCNSFDSSDKCIKCQLGYLSSGVCVNKCPSNSYENDDS